MSPMASPESVRRHNLSLLLRLLHQSGALSRSEIGSSLGMTRSTIGELVADLRARGLVEEGDPARLGAPGRPSLVARPNPEGAAVITAEIAVNSLSAAVVGLGGKHPPPQPGDPSAATSGRGSDDRGRRQAHPDRAGVNPLRLLGRWSRHRGGRGRSPSGRVRPFRAEPRMARCPARPPRERTGSARACR